MEKMLIISLRLPATDSEYEFRVPAGMNTGLVVKLCAKAVEDMSEGMWNASKSCIMAWAEDGRLLDVHRTIEENHVINGSRLLLI